MAYTCDDCKYIFPDKRTSCPFCGGRVYSNSLLEQNLLYTGYSMVPKKMIKDKNQFSSDQQNLYDDLRQAFLNSQSSRPLKDAIPEVPTQNLNSTPSADDVTATSSVDFFSKFLEESNSGIDIPTVEPPLQEYQPESQPQIDPYTQELEELERQRRRLDRQYRRRSVLNFLANIRWRVVFRILFMLALIILAVTIWKMRYVIFNSIISFLVSLLPIFITVWILWYIFHSFFR